MKLTSKSVARLALPLGKSDVIHFDDELPGFGYRIRKSGHRVLCSWVAQYRAAGGTRRITLGSAGTLNADQARTAGKKILAAVTLGRDPARDRRERREGDRFTLRKVIDECLAAKQRSVRPSTMRETTRYLTGSYFAELHRRPIDQISRRDIASCVLRIERKNGVSAAASARTALSALFAWAIAHGLAEINPVVGTARVQAAGPRSRVLSDSELAAIWRAAGDLGDYGSVLRLLILCGARRSEVGGARWSEFDFENAVWSLPADRVKNGRKHVLPLSPLAIEIIESVPRHVDRNHLFGTRGSGFTHWGHAKRALDERLNLAKWCVHDVRRSVATRLCDLGTAPHVVEQILNHQGGHRRGISTVYNLSRYEREVRAALHMWADHVHALATGGKRKVVMFERPTVASPP